MKCCDLTSGKLRNRIDIESPVTAPNGSGGSTVVWTAITASKIRAYIKPISGAERLQAMRLESDITHRVFIRYRSDFTAASRINYNGRLFQIRAILNLEERNQWLELYAVEGPAT